jgi:glycopeptide antibiotics resistance protein
VPELAQPENPLHQPFPDAVRLLSRYGFGFSIAILLYSVLFPFQFDFSRQYLSASWAQAGRMPYGIPQNGIQITLDDLANILLTAPLAFFGVLMGANRKKYWMACKWLVLGLAIGFAAEFAQLAILTRSSGATDAVNNGLGAALGAFAACTIGQRALEFFTGTAMERRNIYLWLLIWTMIAMLGPFNIGSDYDYDTRMIRTDFTESEIFTDKQWLQMACFALIGAMAARLAVPGRRRRTLLQQLSAAALVLLLPMILHFLRILFESYPPYLDDLALGIFGALAGAFISLLIPSKLRAFCGFIMFTFAVLASGLNPYNFSNWQRKAVFQWIPFYDLCRIRTPFAFYETTLSLFIFAILGGLLRLTFTRLRRWHAVLCALAFSGALECAQTFLPARTAGTTDIIMAGMGTWIGAYICSSVESSRSNGQWIIDKAY